MRLILLGAPGAGKGTQANFIANMFHIPKISTGDMLRQAIQCNSPLGKIAQHFMTSGELVPDQLIIDLIKKRITENDCQNGYLFDGFPRTIEQANALLSTKIKIDCIIEIDVPIKELIKRISGRRIHPASGRTYHVFYKPPKIPNLDDETGENLIQRADDSEATVKKRLAIYKKQTQPLILFYKQLSTKKLSHTQQHYPIYLKISGLGTVDDIRKKIFHELEKISIPSGQIGCDTNNK